jgi:hypothetical protein
MSIHGILSLPHALVQKKTEWFDFFHYSRKTWHKINKALVNFERVVVIDCDLNMLCTDKKKQLYRQSLFWMIGALKESRQAK